MKMGILPKHFIRVAASNELAIAKNALENVEALIVSQSFVYNVNKSVGSVVDEYKKPFIIDPETYRYFFTSKRHYKQKKIRAWLNNMSKEFPEEIKGSFGKKKADIANFDAIQLLEFCQANIEIQTSLTNSDGKEVLPVAIMCPYSLIELKNFSQSLTFFKQITNTTNKINKTDLPIIATIYIKRELLLNSIRMREIVSTLNDIECSAVAIWIDDFDETTADEEELENLSEFYSEISNKHVIAMYAGLAQILMMYNGVDSVAHGIHYQMNKNGVADGGGPAHYFYIPNLRQRIRTIEAASIVKRQSLTPTDYLSKICNCIICKNEISYDPATEILSLEGNNGDQVAKLTSHFSYNKKIEINNIETLSKDEYKRWLKDSLSSIKLTKDEDEYADVVLNWVDTLL